MHKVFLLAGAFSVCLISCSPTDTTSRRHNTRSIASLSDQNQTTFLRPGEKYPGPDETSYSGPGTYTSDGTDLISVAYSAEGYTVKIKFEEGNLSDALVTQKLGKKVVQLAGKVEKEWPGVYLRITEAWDTESEHSNFSLHYEGRAIDITTSDKDKVKYARLAGLAIETGFDWVYNEGDHVHASVKK